MFRKKGFTLLELIIVIIVIGILASIALPRYMRVAERARLAEAKNMLSSLRSSQIRYYAQHQEYSASIDKLDIETGTEKYFNYTAADGNTTIPTTPAAINAIGYGVRTDTEQGNFATYTIAIDEDGDLGISDALDYLL